LAVVVGLAACEDALPTNTIEPSSSAESSAKVTTSGGPSTVPASGDTISTMDGTVSVRTSANGLALELVLSLAGGTTSVLASIPERKPDASVDSFGSVHTVDCPPSTGLKQQYYVIGQETGTAGAITLQGLAGVASALVGARYVIVVTQAPSAEQRWSFSVGGEESGGGLGSNFLDLPTHGLRSASGCFFS
jgi:hypothetical protein